MSTISTNIRLDLQTKKESTVIIKGLGMSLSDAVNIFLRQVVLKKGIPFEVRYPGAVSGDMENTSAAI